MKIAKGTIESRGRTAGQSRNEGELEGYTTRVSADRKRVRGRHWTLERCTRLLAPGQMTRGSYREAASGPLRTVQGDIRSTE
jgi:hypothetical protein